MKKIIYIALAVTFFAACEEDKLKLSELGDYNNKLVVNGVIVSNENVEIEVSHSVSTTRDDTIRPIENADVVLTHNGTNINLTYNFGDKNYQAPISPQSGDQFQLDVRADGYFFVNASATIPPSLSANAEIIPEGGLDTSGIPSDLVQVSFQDAAGVRNYYKINFFYYNKTIGQFIPMGFTINDPDLAEFSRSRLNDGSMLFTDELFDGEAKTLGTVATFGLVATNPGDKYMIVLENISEDLYRYFNTLQSAKDAKGNGFANGFNGAVVIHSNIKNGLGILGTSYISRNVLQ